MARVTEYEQRLKQLQKERERLRKDIRSVTKSLQKSGIDLESVHRPAHVAPAEPVRSPAPVPHREPEAAPEPEHVLPVRAAAGPAAAQGTRSGAHPDDRLTSYLSSGSFGKSVPLTRERRVMRNRAIFMLAVVALLAALMYHFFF